MDDETRLPEEEASNNITPPTQTGQGRQADADFGARYSASKEKEIKKLAQEIEEKNNRDTGKKRRNWWIKTILMLVLIGVAVFIMFGINSMLSKDSKSFSDMIKGVDWKWFGILTAIGTAAAYAAVWLFNML